MKKQVSLANIQPANWFVLLIISALFIFSLIRLYPFDANLNNLLVGTDDWNRYARFGLDIKYHGILIPSESGIYEGPGGFLYNYFVALCFLLFGDSIIPIYLIQNLFLGFSIALIYWTFRDKMKYMTGLIFLCTLFIFALLDVYKYYSFQLLSENLALFLVSLSMYYLKKGIETKKFSLQIMAAIFFALAIATRPNLFPIGIVFIVILFFYYIKFKKAEIRKALLLSSIIATGMSLLAIRNYMIAGSWTFLPTLGVSDSLYPFSHFPVTHFLKKVLYCFGFLSAFEPSYQIRPHWIVMWIGYVIYLFLKIKGKHTFEIWETITQLFICSFYVLSIVLVQISSYGFRALIPVTFIVLAFSFMGFENLISILQGNKKMS